MRDVIRNKAKQWISSPDCSVKELIKYMREKGDLRDTQIEAIEVYLFLKIKGENKPLWQLFSEGFFSHDIDISTLNINQVAREYFEHHTNALSLYAFSKQRSLHHLESMIIDTPKELDYERIIKRVFYDVHYADYLMSLPMGAGKTFLMAAIIYLDLYFASNEPDNPHFAHNFLVLIPSGLKSSIGPSLRTIENFDPSWVLPEPAATTLKKQVQFNVLDESKSAKKSNRAQNPNAQKVNQCLPNPFGQVFIVNAEKVILNKFDDRPLFRDAHSKDMEYQQANELRQLIGNIPNLSIFIDEVHHATNADIKLRQVVHQWNDANTSNITTVLGFSGTPYLPQPEKIPLMQDEVLRIAEITNTVYYYPLTTAIKHFLKNPTVKIADNLSCLHIVKAGIENFNDQYRNLTYENGTIAKVAIYCSDIKMLEEEIYPYLQSALHIPPHEILRFHGGNNTYTLPKENELAFRSLDTPLSKKRYILLVGIGKEGWDCKSLTSVILPQKSKSTSKNAIIQTTCRCLRQVIKGKDETALIWLNRENADMLDTQLQKEQRTSIEEISKINHSVAHAMRNRVSRMKFLKLPTIEYYQLQVTYQSIDEDEHANTKEKLLTLLKNIGDYKQHATVTTTDLTLLKEGEIEYSNAHNQNTIQYNAWIFEIAKESFNAISPKQLHEFDAALQQIFEAITEKDTSHSLPCLNEQYDIYAIRSQIRIACTIKRHLKTEQEVIPKKASLLIVDNIKPIQGHENVYPTQQVSEQIVAFDDHPFTQKEFEKQKQEKILPLTQEKKFDEIAKVADETIYPLIEQKDKTFHVLPYNFDSNFEKKFLIEVLRHQCFRNSGLELYFNGERGLTEFVIHCFAKKGGYWSNIGKYTTDFLMIQRTTKSVIYKVLIIETKGEGYANHPDFINKKHFIESEFLQHNNEKFGYKKFDFLYLEDSEDVNSNVNFLVDKIKMFFN